MRERRIVVDWRRAFWILWTLLLVAQAWLATRLPLFVDEAFYWLESRHPALAYDDVPGLTAWLIAIGQMLPVEGTLAVRWPFVLIGAATALWLARAIGSRSGTVAGYQAGVIAMLLPLFAVNGTLALPDVPLTLAVLMTAFALQRLLDSGGSAGRLLLAAGLALGWLSHYRFIVPFAAGGLWLMLDPQGRRLLTRPAVWLAGLAGCAAGLAPLLIQQLATGGRGFAFQFADRHPWQFQPKGLADPLLQALVTTPSLYLLLLAVPGSLWRRPPAAGRALLGIGSATLLLYLALAPFADLERSRLHWPLPAWVLLASLVPLAWQRWSPRQQRLALLASWLAVPVTAAAFGYLAITAVAPQQLAATALYPDHFSAWPRIAERVQDELQRLPDDTVLAADNFMLAAELAFELGGTRPVYSLDHPLNRKHGRQAQLDRFGLGETALRQQARTRPVVLVAEQAAIRLRDRPDWFAEICERLPGAEPAFSFDLDHGRKRIDGWLQQSGALAGCVPAPIAYLHAPEFDATVHGMLDVHGWAIRDRVGIDRMWLTIDGVRRAELAYGRPEPGVQHQFARSDDPNHPAVGFGLRLRPQLTAGRHWLGIEAESHGQSRLVASVPFVWVPQGADGPAR